MNKLDALKSIAEGINALIDLEIGNAIPVSEEPKQEDVPKKSKVASLAEKKAEKKVKEKKEEVDVDSMDYRQLKSYASEIGVKAKGTKGQLLKAVKDFLANGGEDAEEDAEEEVEEKPAKKPVRGVASMKAKKKAEEEGESEENDSESEEEDTTIVRNTEKEVERAIEEQELTDDDLRDILKDLGLSTKGGHEVLVSKLADAVDTGELSLDDDEVEEETDEAEDEAEETESEKEDVEDEEEDAEEDDEEAEITAERKQAVDDFTAETTEAFENEELSVEDMRDFIKDFGEKISKKASDKEVLAKYIECASMLIDDEGNTVEEGAYMLNGVPFCCGHALEISEDETSGKCSICGEEYEFEE